MPRVCCCCALSLAVLCSACLPPSLANDVQADNNQARSAAFYALPNAPAAERNSASSSSSSSAAAAAIPLWPAGRVPSERADSVGAEYETCLTKGVAVADCQDLSVHNVTVPTISPYLVDGADSAVVIAPGGGYGILAINREGTDIAAWLNSIGVSAFVLKYRVPGRSWLPFGAAPLMDAQRAMGLVREMASSGKIKGLNESKVGFMGFSAGGHLTGHLNVAWASRSYAHIDAADAKPCRPNFSMMIYPWESVTQPPVSASKEQASALNVTKDTPPTMLVQAEDDPVHCENALFYYHALKLAGAGPSELHLYPRGGHGYGRCTNPGHGWHEVCTWPARGAVFMATLGVAPCPPAGGFGLCNQSAL